MDSQLLKLRDYFNNKIVPLNNRWEANCGRLFFIAVSDDKQMLVIVIAMWKLAYVYLSLFDPDIALFYLWEPWEAGT